MFSAMNAYFLCSNEWDILYVEDLDTYNKEYLKYTSQVAESCQDRDLSTDSMVIGTSAIIDTEIDGERKSEIRGRLKLSALLWLQI